MQFEPAFSVTPIETSAGVVDGNTITGVGNMNLMTYKTSATPVIDDAENQTGILYGFTSGGSTYYQKAVLGNLEKWRFYKVTVQIVERVDPTTGITYSASEIATMLGTSKQGYDLSIAADTGSAAVFYKAGEDDQAGSGEHRYPEGAGSANISASGFADDKQFSTTEQSYYFGMYIDGDIHNNDTITSGNFTVTLTVVTLASPY